MNINPTLILGRAIDWLDKQGTDIRPHERQYIELRIYPAQGAGFYFVRGMSALKWYYDDDPTDGHWSNCSLEDVQAAIDANARVQLIGIRGISYGVWPAWGKFVKSLEEKGE